MTIAQTPESKIRKSIVDTALSFKGVPYVYGAASPSAFDCSGFVKYVYNKAVGIMLPRTSRALYAEGTSIKPERAKPGDVLVFDTVGGAPSHVAIVLDDGSMIHAASDGPRTGVIVSPKNDKYFAPRLIGARVFIAGSAPEKNPEPVKAPTRPAPYGASAKTTPAAVPSTAVKPAASPAPKKPAAVEKSHEDDPVVSTVGFSITNEAINFTDKIPAAVGTAVQFAVTNDTGADGVFEILFYKMDKDPSKAQTLRKDRIKIRAGGMTETDPILFTEPGQYKLILKTHDNIKRVERVWKVVAVK
ncbi:MAG: NlpC/P60 family protein [Treponemataceae bacterium]